MARKPKTDRSDANPGPSPRPRRRTRRWLLLAGLVIVALAAVWQSYDEAKYAQVVIVNRTAEPILEVELERDQGTQKLGPIDPGRRSAAEYARPLGRLRMRVKMGAADAPVMQSILLSEEATREQALVQVEVGPEGLVYARNAGNASIGQLIIRPIRRFFGG